MPYTKDFHSSPYGQRGGLAIYPVAGVVDGAVLSIQGSGIDGGDASLAAVTISAGTIRVDGYPISFAEINTTVQSDVTNLATEDTVVKVWMSPTRLYPTFTPGNAPSPASYDEGSYAIEYTEVDGGTYGKYQMVENLYIKENGAWRLVDGLQGDFSRSFGWNNMPFNDLNTAATPLVTSEAEAPMFLASKLPPHISSYNALFRQTASILLGTLTFVGGVPTITPMPEYHLLPV